MIGQTISHYRILSELGRGGMGEVFLAEDTELDRKVALKFLPPHYTSDAELNARFRREAKAAAALNHPNIITVHEIGEHEGRTYIAMEYVEGESLREKVSSGQLSVDSAVDIASQICDGLNAAHQAGIIHRDIKPENVIVDKSGRVRILDFGLARIHGKTKLTKDSATLGTIFYMSPEQFSRAGGIDHRADIWAVGVVLYEMLSGELPFQGEYDQAVMYAVCNEKPQPISSLRPDVPVGLEQVVESALQKKVDVRYQGVDEILVDLQDDSQTVGAKKPHLGPTKLLKAKPALLWPALVLSAIAIAIAGYFFFGKEAASTERIPIAVVSFENMTGDTTYNFLQKAIPNLLITSLEQSPNLQVATWERLRDLLKQTGKEYTEIIDKDLGYELCRMDGINTIVVGSFTKAGNAFTTEVRILDVSSKRLLKGAIAKGKGEESILLTQVDELSREISKGIGLAETRIAITQRPIAEVTTTSMPAYNYFIRGRDEYERFNYSEAMLFLKKAVTLDSTLAMGHYYIGRVYLHYAKYQSRTEAFKKAKAYSQNVTDKERLQIEKSYAAVVERNIEKYRNLLQLLIKKYPKEKRFHHELAGDYNIRGMHRQAIEASNKALELDPNWGNAYNKLGYAYKNLGEFDKAIASFKHYARVSPGDSNPLDSMAETYLAMGKLDEAIANYKEALTINPDWYARPRIAYCYALKEDFDEALKWHDKWIQKAGPAPSLYYLKAIYQHYRGSRKGAFYSLTKDMQIADSLDNEFFKKNGELFKAWIYYDVGGLELGRIAMKNHFEYFITSNLADNAYYNARYSSYLGFVNAKEERIDSTRYYLYRLKSLLPELEASYASYFKNIFTFSYYLLYGEKLLIEDSLSKAISVGQQLSSIDFRMPPMQTGIILPYNFPFSRVSWRAPTLERVISTKPLLNMSG